MAIGRCRSPPRRRTGRRRRSSRSTKSPDPLSFLGRQTSGSVVCISCGRLVGVRDEQCFHCGRRNPSLFGYSHVLRRLGSDLGFVKLIIGACAALYFVSLLLSPGAFEFRGLFSALAPDSYALFRLGASGAAPVFGFGYFWTVLSASLLHGGLLHILFNMMWVRDLAPSVANLYGAGRMVLVWTSASIVGFTASSAAQAFLPPFPLLGGGKAQLTVGASAAIFGLLGALVCYGRRTGQSAMRQQVWTWAVVMFVFGLVMPGIDNWAHAGGFAGGYGAARVLDPLKPERIHHLALAVVCLALTGLAVVLSLVLGSRLLAQAGG